MSSNDSNNVRHSKPIAIDPHRQPRRRSDSASDSSSSDDSSPSPSSPPPQSGFPGTQPHIIPMSPTTSPILSYFLSGQSPKSASTTFPFRRNVGVPVPEDDEVADNESKATKHGRRASTAWAGGERFAQPPPVSGTQQERAAGLLRRLSLGGTLARPQFPNLKPVSGANGATAASTTQRPSTPPNSPAVDTTPRRPRRANTVNPSAPRPPRAPSPMGERILSGHFDGFN
ncbi:hypothetical protein BKA93DRAFT_828325 [Sparassis latifolia]